MLGCKNTFFFLLAFRNINGTKFSELICLLLFLLVNIRLLLKCPVIFQESFVLCALHGHLHSFNFFCFLNLEVIFICTSVVEALKSRHTLYILCLPLQADDIFLEHHISVSFSFIHDI